MAESIHNVVPQSDQEEDVCTLTGSLVEKQQRGLRHTPSQARSHNSQNSSIGRLIDIAKGTDMFQSMNMEVEQDRKRLSLMMQRLSIQDKQEQQEEEEDDESNDALDDADIIIVNSSPGRLPRHSSAGLVSHSDLNLASDTNNYHSAQQSVDSFEFERPEPTIISRESTSSSSFKRRSYVSDYAPSIHEAEEVQIISQDPSQNRLDNSNIGNSSRDVLVNNQPTLLKKVIARSNDDLNATSDSVVSFETANSDVSRYAVSTYSKTAAHSSPYETKSVRSRTSSHARENSNDSTMEIPIGDLQTKRSSIVLFQDHDRSRSVELNPSIPSRSPNRPTSMTATTTKQLRDQLRRQRPHSTDVNAMDDLLSELDQHVSRSGSEAGSPSAQQTKHISQVSESPTVVVPSTPRPLPPPPPPAHITAKHSHKSQVSNIAFEEPAVSPPKHVAATTTTAATATAAENGDDGFVTEEEEEEDEQEEHLDPTPTRYKKHRSVKSTKTSRSRSSHTTTTNSSTYTRRSMNHETLMKLLQVTEGTIIGQEFQELGLDDSEKQLLERLVDSLSRLTADMIIDGERKTESLRRLSRAIKALEGF